MAKKIVDEQPTPSQFEGRCSICDRPLEPEQTVTKWMGEYPIHLACENGWKLDFTKLL